MFEHYSVLLDETIDALNIKEDGIYVDCTLGGGGHSSRILEKLTTGHLYCFDQDTNAIEAARERLSKILTTLLLSMQISKRLRQDSQWRAFIR